VRLDVEAIAVAARARAGVPADTPLRFLDPLARLAGALEREAGLTEGGARAVHASLIAALVTQLQVADAVEQNPGIAKTELPRPVFIVGLLRTGSTLLHNLLGLHPGLRAPALWELMNPVGSYDPAEQEQLATATKAYVEEYYQVAPKLPDIHYLDALRPDECHRLTGLTFATMVYTMRYRVPSYGAWLAGEDLTWSYEYHRELLRAILWRRPGGPFVGKDPFHLWSLDALHAVYPDARYVHLHRDPTETVPSTCSLCSALRVARSDRLDLPEIGRQWVGEVDRGVALAEAARSGPLAGAPVLDVRYPDLVADPIGVVGTILDFLGEPMTGEAERRMRGFLAGQAERRPGAHRYTAADFGLSVADLSRRYAGYRDTYRV
jgi:Sulfotransferase family